jgi:hypothetical protein
MKKKIKAVPILLALAGGAVGFFSAQAGIKVAETMPTSVFITLVILFIPSFFLVVALHEAGHALAGVWVNFDFRMYVVGPFLWEKEAGTWKFKWNKNVNTSGGMVLCLPTHSEDLRNRFARFAAGGPLASLVSGGIFAGLYELLTRVYSPVLFMQVMTGWTAILAFLSAVIFLITAIPFHTGGFSSDGARVLRLYRGGAVARFEVLLLKIIATSSAGVRPSQWSVSELEEALTLAREIDAPMRVYLYYFFYHHALDTHNLSRAEEYLNHYITEADAVPPGIRAGIWIEAAFFYAHIKKDLDKATPYWNQYKPSSFIPKALVLGTEAALCQLRGETDQATSLCEKAMTEIPTMLDRGVAMSLKDQFQEMLTATNRIVHTNAPVLLP